MKKLFILFITMFLCVSATASCTTPPNNTSSTATLANTATASTSALIQIVTPTTPPGGPFTWANAASPDGNLWFTEMDTNNIGDKYEMTS